MTSDKDKWRLNHIIEAIEYIGEFIVDVKKDQFFKDYEKQCAVIRQFEIIGEAANNLSSDLLSSNPPVDWREVVSMRNVMIHDYFEVNVEVVWDTIKEDLPKLKSQIQDIIDKLGRVKWT